MVDEVCITSPHLACIARTAPHFRIIIIICPKKRTCRRDMAVIFVYHFSLSIPRMLTIYVPFFGFLRGRFECVSECVCVRVSKEKGLPSSHGRSIDPCHVAEMLERSYDWRTRYVSPYLFDSWAGRSPSALATNPHERWHVKKITILSCQHWELPRKAPARRRCWPLQDENG